MSGRAKNPSKYNHWEARWIVARNPNASPEDLAKLSKDKKWFIRGVTAQNSNTPPESLVELSNDEHPLVRSAARKNIKKNFDSWDGVEQVRYVMATMGRG